MEDSHDSQQQDEDLDLLSGFVVVYAAMLAATIAGQLLGIGLDSLLGSGSIGIPVGLSVALEAVAGARLGAARSGGALTPRQAARISVTYSGALLAISVPLVVWMEAAHTANGGGRAWTPTAFGVAIALLAVATVVRWGLMVVLSRRRA
jgi:hypothetical protein